MQWPQIRMNAGRRKIKKKNNFNLFALTRNSLKNSKRKPNQMPKNFGANDNVWVQRSIEVEFVTVEWYKPFI